MFEFFSELVMAVLIGSLLQNIVLSGAYGVSEAVRVSGRGKQRFILTGLIGILTLTSSVIIRVLQVNTPLGELGVLFHYALYFLVIVFLYFIIVFVARKLIKTSTSSLGFLGVAAFNALVLALPILNRSSGAGMAETIGMALGATLAFFITTQLIHAGLHKLMHNDEIPDSFEGNPVIFIYIGLIALAFMGFAGQSLFV